MVVLDRNGTMSSKQTHVTTESQYYALMGMNFRRWIRKKNYSFRTNEQPRSTPKWFDISATKYSPKITTLWKYCNLYCTPWRRFHFRETTGKFWSLYGHWERRDMCCVSVLCCRPLFSVLRMICTIHWYSLQKCFAMPCKFLIKSIFFLNPRLFSFHSTMLLDLCLLCNQKISFSQSSQWYKDLTQLH